MNPDQVGELEAVLLCLSEARERAEGLARELRTDERSSEIVALFEEADRILLGLHGDLMRSAYFGTTGEADEPSQLELAS